jgi:hypothetical protein
LGYRQFKYSLKLTRTRFPTFSPYSTPAQFTPLGSGDDFATFDMLTLRPDLNGTFSPHSTALNPGF